VVLFELILGGAAVHRCGNCTVLNAASAAEGRQFSNCVTTNSSPCKPQVAADYEWGALCRRQRGVESCQKDL